MDLTKTVNDFPTPLANRNRDINRVKQERPCMDALEEAGGPLSSRELANITGISYTNLHNVLSRPLCYGRIAIAFATANGETFYKMRYDTIQPIALITSKWIPE
jgi:hypothetical protein